MPSTSQSQQQASAIALHHPEKLYKRNRALLKMSADELEKFASTSHRGLPKKTTIGHLMPEKRR